MFPEDGYISSIPLDPWVENTYEYPSRKDSKYDLYTLGADGIEGGSGEDADIETGWNNKNKSKGFTLLKYELFYLSLVFQLHWLLLI